MWLSRRVIEMVSSGFEEEPTVGRTSKPPLSPIILPVIPD